MDYIVIWRSIFHLEAVGLADYSNILKVAKLFLILVVANVKTEIDFSQMKRVAKIIGVSLARSHYPS